MSQEIPIDSTASPAEIINSFDQIDTLAEDNTLSQITNVEIFSHKSYKDFMTALENAVECSSQTSSSETRPDVIEICMDSSEGESVVDIDSGPTPLIATKDPLTLQNIQNPVRNQICGHIYETRTIMEFIHAQKKVVPFPYTGCPNLNLCKEHLRSDEKLVEKVKQKQKIKTNGRQK
ncbi:unnamed protein product [Allacma fusca]|uniref:E3 SUMO-protein ligase NSE2 n=1 Tax=Allacma fusca TaxID=39272 RepID=A0A8J2J839_9HEXA|nr:unnamed protein product [Allacma fusca]